MRTPVPIPLILGAARTLVVENRQEDPLGTRIEHGLAMNPEATLEDYRDAWNISVGLPTGLGILGSLALLAKSDTKSSGLR